MFFTYLHIFYKKTDNTGLRVVCPRILSHLSPTMKIINNCVNEITELNTNGKLLHKLNIFKNVA